MRIFPRENWKKCAPFRLKMRTPKGCAKGARIFKYGAHYLAFENMRIGLRGHKIDFTQKWVLELSNELRRRSERRSSEETTNETPTDLRKAARRTYERRSEEPRTEVQRIYERISDGTTNGVSTKLQMELDS